MSASKELRKSLRNVVQDLLPDLLKSEFGTSLHKDISKVIQTRLDVMMKEIQDTLKTIDQRSKDVQGYLVRSTLKPVAANQEGDKNEEEKRS